MCETDIEISYLTYSKFIILFIPNLQAIKNCVALLNRILLCHTRTYSIIYDLLIGCDIIGYAKFSDHLCRW